MDGSYLYILRCTDGSYYVGTTRTDLEFRVAQHQDGCFEGYTASRRPVVLVYADYFAQIVDAIAAERQIKGWTRAKKEALIAGDFARLTELSKRRKSSREGTIVASTGATSSFETQASPAPQDEVDF